MAEENEGGEEKSEEPSQRKLQKAHEKGDAAVSKEVPTVATFFMILLVFHFFGMNFFDQIELVLKKYFQFNLYLKMDAIMFAELMRSATYDMVPIILPVFAAVMIATIGGTIAQTGLMFNGEALTLKPDKLSPIKGFEKIFSLNAIVEGIKAFSKVGIVGIIAYSFFQKELIRMPVLYTKSVRELLGYLFTISLKIAFYVALIMIVLAALDWAYQRWSWMKKQRMSKKELTDERKDTEGNPQIKSRQRSIQMQESMKRMMQDVPKADVIITNPTHFAVALTYDREVNFAPIVIAKGQDFLAQKIKEIARENNVPIVENKPVARGLYKHSKIGQQIPLDFFKPVAEILAYIYRLKNQTKEWTA